MPSDLLSQSHKEKHCLSPQCPESRTVYWDKVERSCQVLGRERVESVRKGAQFQFGTAHILEVDAGGSCTTT